MRRRTAVSHVLAHASSAQPRLGIGRAIAGYVFGLLLALVFSVASLAQLRLNSKRMDQLIDREAQDVVEFQRLVTLSERSGRTGQKYLLTGREEYARQARSTQHQLAGVLQELQTRATAEPSRAAMSEVVRLADAYYDHLYHAIARRQRGAPESEWVNETEPAWEALEAALTAATNLEVRDLSDARRRAGEQTSSAFNLIFGGTALAVAVGILMTLLIVRSLRALERSRTELASTLDLLAERNRDLDAFAGRVAHDLRNILAPLPIAVATLRDTRSRPEQVEAVTERVSRVGTRATALLETLLAFARSGRSAADPYTGAPVRAAVAEALETLAAAREEAAAEVEVDVGDAAVVCAPALLQTLMTNLLSNAFKFLSGRPQRRVRVAARVREGVCQLTVEDTGPGIAPQDLPRIFEPFYRTPGTRAPGSGLGLATVHRIVEAAGGSISVWSQLDQGTRFTLDLPAAPDPTSPGSDARARVRLPDSPPSLAPS